VTGVQWAAFVAEQPRLARVGRQRLIDPGVALVGTIRADGTPRISPVEPLLWQRDLWLCMMWRSRKAADLRGDRRVLVHSIVTGRDGAEGEFKVRGVAREEIDPARQTRFAAEAARRLGWRAEVGRFHLFAVDIADVTFIRYDAATGDQHVIRWPQASEVIRRATSPTSVGPAEPRPDGLLRRDPH
jgi:hypothetical protein